MPVVLRNENIPLFAFGLEQVDFSFFSAEFDNDVAPHDKTQTLEPLEFKGGERSIYALTPKR